jgi:hypothetical protein
MIASKYAARANFVLHENAEDLASYFFIRCHVIRPLRVSNRRSHKLNTTASDGLELQKPANPNDLLKTLIFADFEDDMRGP